MQFKEYTFIKVDVADDVTTIIFNRPAVRNALNSKMIKELTEAVGDATTLFIVFKGAGDVFSAGADVEYMRRIARMGYEENLKDAKLLALLFSTIAHSTAITISVVQGAAMGGANGIIAASDLSIAATSTLFSFSEVKLGLLPATVSPYVLAKVGRSRTLELFLTGRQFDASEALAIGLLSKACHSTEVDAVLGSLLENLRSNSPAAMRSVKRLINTIDNLVDDAEQITPTFIADARASFDGQEGLSAFIEKRKPRWFNADSDGKGW